MRVLSGLFCALITTVFISPAFAHENGSIGEIQTKELKLTYIDHVLSGAIGANPVYAYPLPDQYGLNVMHHGGAELFTSEFKKSEEVLGGTLRSRNSDGAEVETKVVFSKINAAEGKIFGTVNGDAFEVAISSEEMSGHHYVDPHFAIKVGEKTYEFDLKNGQACIGCAVKITYVVVGLLRVNGTL